MPERGQEPGRGRLGRWGGRVPRAGLLAGLGVVVAASAAAAAVFAPGEVLPWAGGVATAALAGYLGQVAPSQLGTALGRRRTGPDAEPTGSGAPFTFAVRIRNQDLVSFDLGDRVVDVPAAGHTVRLVVTGSGPRSVVLTGLRAEVLGRSERYGELARHAAAIPPRTFAVALDGNPPVVRPLGDSDFPYGLTADETEVFDLRADLGHGLAEWVLWLDWTTADRGGTTRIDLDGRPFRTAARGACA
ncbi:hypothetical protein [Streptomyces sp. NPDC101206]|uniref:hypothetical protein n=1 Tax=Streptomyces sp. NPDC101206 TaxID=3366128 RepID=UPI00381C7356